MSKNKSWTTVALGLLVIMSCDYEWRKKRRPGRRQEARTTDTTQSSRTNAATVASRQTHDWRLSLTEYCKVLTANKISSSSSSVPQRKKRSTKKYKIKGKDSREQQVRGFNKIVIIISISSARSNLVLLLASS